MPDVVNMFHNPELLDSEEASRDDEVINEEKEEEIILQQKVKGKYTFVKEL